MPSTINGIGTWYWGKSNLVTRNDTCESCGQFAQLKSYDTTLYFVVFFIPVIPLGKKRVIDECPRCTRHRSLGLGKWNRLKDESILQKTQAWQTDRASKDKACDAIGATIAFHDADSFNQIAPAVRGAFAGDADVQILLGDAYDHFGDATSADGAYRAAVVTRADEASKEAFAKFLLRQSRPADAQPLLRHILDARQRDKASLLLALAQNYQAAGDHEAASQLLDEVGTAFPDLLSDPDFERIRRSSTKYRGTTEKIGAKYVAQRDGVQRTSWLGRHAGALLVGGVLLVAAAWYFGLAYRLGTHRVMLVNGTAADYEAVINGTSHLVRARGHVPIEIAEGSLAVSVPKLANQIEPQKLELRTNFWKRPFNRRTFVLNPDRVAVILWQKTVYGDSNSHGDHDFSLNVGNALYDFEKVDYIFEEFPPSLRVPDRSSSQAKTRVAAVRDFSPEKLADVLKQSAGAEASRKWVERYLLLTGDSADNLAALAGQLEPKELIAFLRAHLSDRPVRIESHRLYQHAVERHESEYDLTKEYEAMLAKEPANAALIYLLGRTHLERDQSLALYRRAAEASPPCAYASYALGYDALSDCRFEEALQHAQKARQLEPGNPRFVSAELDALEALGRWKPALEVVRGRQTHDGYDQEHVARELRLLVRDGQNSAAQGRLALYVEELNRATGGDEAIVKNTRNTMETVLHYAQGDMAAYRKCLGEAEGTTMTFQCAVADGKWKEAAEALEKLDAAASGHLVVYVGAALAGQQEIARASWDRAVAAYRKGDRPARRLADALASSDAPADAVLRNWSAVAQERALLLAALGLRYPQHKEKYFAVARKLNYSVEFPHHLIAQALGAPTR